MPSSAYDSGLFISWAMPASSVPSAASRSDCARRASISLRSVTSRAKPRIDGTPSQSTGIDCTSVMTQLPSLRRVR